MGCMWSACCRPTCTIDGIKEYVKFKQGKATVTYGYPVKKTRKRLSYNLHQSDVSPELYEIIPWLSHIQYDDGSFMSVLFTDPRCTKPVKYPLAILPSYSSPPYQWNSGRDGRKWRRTDSLPTPQDRRLATVFVGDIRYMHNNPVSLANLGLLEFQMEYEHIRIAVVFKVGTVCRPMLFAYNPNAKQGFRVYAVTVPSCLYTQFATYLASIRRPPQRNHCQWLLDAWTQPVWPCMQPDSDDEVHTIAS
jgi:hypothetical protein